MTHALALAPALMLLAGCASLAPLAAVPPEPDLPAGWSSTLAGVGVPANERWWDSFNDALLVRLVNEAQRANTDVQSAQAVLRQARAMADVGVAALQPQIDSRASAQGNRRTSNLFQIGLDAGWELDLFGGQRSGVLALQATALASAAQLANVRVSIAAEVGLLYITLRGEQARLNVARHNLEIQQQTLQIASWREQAGLLSSLEVQQARSVTAQTQALLPQFQASIQQTVHALALLTGQPPASLNELLQPWGPQPEPQGPPTLTLPVDTLRQRADVRVAEQQVRAAYGRLAQADAARWPSFNLGGSLGLQALTLGALGSGPLVASLIASASWPVWDGGSTRAQIDAQDGALEQARSHYRSVVLTALQEVEDALAALAGDGTRQRHLSQASTAAEAAATLAAQRYRSGLVDFQTVLETQRSQLATQDALATARTNTSSDHIRLFKALGGGWEPQRDLAFTVSRVEAP